MKPATGTTHHLDELCVIVRAIRNLAFLADGMNVSDEYDHGERERQSSLLCAIGVLAAQVHDEIDALQGRTMGFVDRLRADLAERQK